MAFQIVQFGIGPNSTSAMVGEVGDFLRKRHDIILLAAA